MRIRARNYLALKRNLFSFVQSNDISWKCLKLPGCFFFIFKKVSKNNDFKQQLISG